MSESMGNAYSGPSLLSRIALVFIPYIVISVVHVWALATGHEISYPTKLMLMPILASAVLLGMIGAAPFPRGVTALLIFAVGFSWLGDGSSFFFPMFEDELPMMLACFGVAHLLYMWLFWRGKGIGTGKPPWWAYGYIVWWAALIVILGPHTGDLLGPVMVYGLVLGGTAFLAARCGPVIAWGGFAFLLSDSILAFRLFLPESMPAWTSPAVMLTYTLGQGLIAYGVVRALRFTESLGGVQARGGSTSATS